MLIHINRFFLTLFFAMERCSLFKQAKNLPYLLFPIKTSHARDFPLNVFPDVIRSKVKTIKDTVNVDNATS